MNDKKNREPMVIALATGKGGSMKTTSAVFLACALVDQSRGEQHVLVADADVQGDAKDWWHSLQKLFTVLEEMHWILWLRRRYMQPRDVLRITR